ncbi:MAG: class I SAM-dependent methyltransferase [Undibacterium sp.]|uniref:class I SAM-dependent methyltransferase n=1 Tax=Undibacterium sp. TaxID=1914977 RepID=UPI00271FEDDD|nr:class I SAM-dependent methyltransferase [Undibacterium sp.]MDO8653382.1 class I SAM-dependent methyltransferase [Undibacterium sp.]
MPHLSDLVASSWVQRFFSLIPRDQGPVLDLACGGGRHTRLLLDAGYEVWALDKDAVLLKPLEALGARCFRVDLEASSQDVESGEGTWPFDANMFSGIVVTNYLYRPLFERLISSLKEEGVLIYETFSKGNEVYGRPRNPDFLLQSGELLNQLLSDSRTERKNHCIAYEHGYVEHPHPAIVQRICIRSISHSNPSDDRLDSI